MNLLKALSSHGANNGADFNDELGGWLGWGVSTDYSTLTVSFTPYSEDGDAEIAIRRWRLVPVAD